MKVFSFLKTFAFLLLLTPLIFINKDKELENSTLIQTSSTEFSKQDKVSVNAVSESIYCDGNWFNSDKTGVVDLRVIDISQWGLDTTPSIISHTINTSNIVVIGHNWCVNGNCYNAGSQFGNIINIKVGERASLCVNNKLYSGYVFVSKPISEYNTEVMNDWTKFDTVTMFTSYGNCKNSACLATDQRWLIAFERN